MFIDPYIALTDYMKNLSATNKFFASARYPQSGDMNSGALVKMTDLSDADLYLNRSGDGGTLDNLNGMPSYKLQMGAGLTLTGAKLGELVGTTEGTIVCTLKRGGVYASTMYLCDDWQSYLYVSLALGGEADSDSLRGFVGGSFSDIGLPSAEPFVMILTYKQGEGYTMATGKDSASGAMASALNADIANRAFQITTPWAEASFIWLTDVLLMDRVLTAGEINCIKTFAKPYGCLMP